MPYVLQLQQIALVGGAGLSGLSAAGLHVPCLDPPAVTAALRQLLRRARRRGVPVLLPVDLVVGDTPAVDVTAAAVTVAAVTVDAVTADAVTVDGVTADGVAVDSG
jgi:Mrp family chromosome partitioning ATPase